MIFVFRFLRFSSLKSFCAPRQALSSALSMVTALLRSCSIRYLQIIQDTQHGGRNDNLCSLKSSPVLMFIMYYSLFDMLFKFHNKCSYAKDVKRAGRGRRGLDLEAKGWVAQTLVFYFSRRNAVEGLDRLGTVGMTKDSPFGYKLASVVSGESFGMESFTQLSQDKNKIRVRSPEILYMR